MALMMNNAFPRQTDGSSDQVIPVEHSNRDVGGTDSFADLDALLDEVNAAAASAADPVPPEGKKGTVLTDEEFNQRPLRTDSRKESVFVKSLLQQLDDAEVMRATAVLPAVTMQEMHRWNLRLSRV